MTKKYLIAEIEPSIHRQWRILAAKKNVSMGELLRQVALEYMKTVESRPKESEVKSNERIPA